MNIIVNGKPRSVAATTLAEVLAELGYTNSRIATAHDSEFVPAERRAACRLKEGDKVEILGPMQGG
jgi:sulfur carrier protein